MKLLSRPWRHLGGRDVEGRIALALELGEVERPRRRPATTSVTALVKYSAPGVPTYVSTMGAWLPASAITRLRGWETVGPKTGSDRKTR